MIKKYARLSDKSKDILSVVVYQYDSTLDSKHTIETGSQLIYLTDFEALSFAKQLLPIKELVKRLKEAQAAIKQMPVDALGMGGTERYQYPIRDELLSYIESALEPFGGNEKDV